MEPDIGHAVLDVDGDRAVHARGGRRWWSPSLPREEVVQAPPQLAQQAAPAWQGPSAHLWQPPSYINLTMVEDNDD